MKFKQLEYELRKISSQLPQQIEDPDIGIWIWEDHERSTNFHACPAEKVYLTTFKDAIMISCDMKGSKKSKIGNEIYRPGSEKIEKETFIEKIAREYNIPVEEAKKRAEHFFGDLKPMSEETRKLIKDAKARLK